MAIIGIEVPLKDGETWDDLLTVSMTRQDWNVTLALLVEKGNATEAVIEAAIRDAEKGDTAAALAALVLSDTRAKIADAVRKIVEVAHPETAREARAEAAHNRWLERMGQSANMFRDLTDTEEADFRQWARDNFTPGDRIDPVWHPVVRDECDRINIDGS